MQDEISLLRKLQDFDLRIEAIRDRSHAQRESLEELQKLLESLTESLESQRERLEEARTMMRDKERELAENELQFNQSKGKLSQVTNTREYHALETEMNAQKTIQAQLQEEKESLADALEGYTAEVADRASKTEELEAQIKVEEAALAKETGGADKEIAALVKERDALKASLPKQLFRRYEFIASRRQSPAVVAAHDGVCTGCHMRMPPQLFNELQVGRKIIQCPSCQRIMFHDPLQSADEGA